MKKAVVGLVLVLTVAACAQPEAAMETMVVPEPVSEKM